MKMGIFANEQLQAGRYADWLFFWKLVLREAEAGKEVIQNGSQSESVER